MRYWNEARITLLGDRALAQKYVSEGRKFLGALTETSPQLTAVRELTNAAGIHFRVGYFNGTPFITITAPIGGGGTRVIPKLLSGYLVGPRTKASLTGYTAEPFVLLEPTAGLEADWKTWFKVPLEDPPDSASHPTDDFIGDLRFYNDVLGTSVATDAYAARSSVNNAWAAYWQNPKKDLIVQYSGQPPLSESFGYDGGNVTINGRLVLSNAVLYDICEDIVPGTWMFLYAAAAKRTLTGLTLYLAVKTAPAIYGQRTLRIITVPLEPVASEKERLKKYKPDVPDCFGYAGRYEPIVSGVAYQEIYSHLIVGNVAYGGSNGAFSPDLSEFRCFAWREEAGGVYIDELVTNLSDPDDIQTEVIHTEGPLYVNSLNTVTVTSVISLNFTFGTRYLPSSRTDVVTEGGPSSTAKYRCIVDYLPSGIPVYGYLINRVKSTLNSYTNTYSSTGTIANNVDCETHSSYTLDESTVDASPGIWIPKLAEDGTELPDEWVRLGVDVLTSSRTAQGSLDYTAIDSGDPGHADPSNVWAKTLSGSSDSTASSVKQTNTLLWLDLKTRSAALIIKYDESFQTVSVVNTLATPDPNANSAIAPRKNDGSSTNIARIKWQQMFWHAEELVLDTGIITTKNLNTVSTINSTLYQACTEVINSTETPTTVPPASSSVGSTSYYDVVDDVAIGTLSSSQFDMCMVARKDSYLITGCKPLPGNLTTGSFTYERLSQASNNLNPDTSVDNMLGAHDAESYTPSFLISGVLASTQTQEQP